MQENEVICTPTGHMLSSLENKFQSSTISDEMREFVLNQLLYLPSCCICKTHICKSIYQYKKTYLEAIFDSRQQECFLPNDDGIKVRVCLKSFLATLSVTGTS